jgi:hypothetical protein
MAVSSQTPFFLICVGARPLFPLSTRAESSGVCEMRHLGYKKPWRARTPKFRSLGPIGATTRRPIVSSKLLSARVTKQVFGRVDESVVCTSYLCERRGLLIYGCTQLTFYKCSPWIFILVPPNLIPSHLISSHLIPSHLILSQCIPSHLALVCTNAGLYRDHSRNFGSREN